MRHLTALGIGLIFFGGLAVIAGLILLAIVKPWIGVPILLLGLAYLVGGMWQETEHLKHCGWCRQGLKCPYGGNMKVERIKAVKKALDKGEK